MTAEKQFWRDFWDAKAGEKTDFRATGRGGMDIIGFLYTVREIARLLDLEKDDRLLDVGCGTGLIALALSPFVRSVTAVDLSQRMLQRVKENVSDAANIEVQEGSLDTLSALDRQCFDKILAYSVLQYLGAEEARLGLKEVARAMAPGGRALIAANPDPARRQSLMDAIIMKPDAEARKVEMQLLERTGWFSFEELAEWAGAAGLVARCEPISPRIWQHFYMFDLVLTHCE